MPRHGVRYLETAPASPVGKGAMATDLAPMRALFGRSLMAGRNLPAGRPLRTLDVDELLGQSDLDFVPRGVDPYWPRSAGLTPAKVRKSTMSNRPRPRR